MDDLPFESGDYVVCDGEDSFFAGRIICPIVKYNRNLIDHSVAVRFLVQDFDGVVLIKNARQMRKSTRGDVIEEMRKRLLVIA
jgi:hypothetical protein